MSGIYHFQNWKCACLVCRVLLSVSVPVQIHAELLPFHDEDDVQVRASERASQIKANRKEHRHRCG